jgi:hypothetical protein
MRGNSISSGKAPRGRSNRAKRLENADLNHPAAAEKKFAFLAEFLYLLCTGNSGTASKKLKETTR